MFHRFCGDDQTFFVATMTSRPIGLETAFSIQLADKQPVLRGMCVVLDAWETSDNRYKRPGIRLGIKRLTADSQVVFDRLRAAARSPAALVEGTPAPGPPPAPTPSAPGPPSALPALASAAPPRPPAFSLRSTATPPQLPSLIVPRTGGSSIRATTQTPPEALRPPAMIARQSLEFDLPAPVERRPADAGPAEPAPVEPPPVAPRSAEPKPKPRHKTLAPTSLLVRPASVKRGEPVEVPPPAVPPLVVSEVEAKIDDKFDASADEPATAVPAPIEVTRFQVALNVDAAPPPLDGVEFKPTQLVPRPRIEPRIGDGPPDDEPGDPAGDAVIVDRPDGELRRAVPITLEPASSPAHEPRPADPPTSLRTPGSALVLPANPLHDLSDESLEGFVDCTLYEESGSVFHPGIDGDEDDPADPPIAPPAPGTLPAMPFDTAPNLTVRSHGNTESLALAPEEPAPGVPAPASQHAGPPPHAPSWSHAEPPHAPSWPHAEPPYPTARMWSHTEPPPHGPAPSWSQAEPPPWSHAAEAPPPEHGEPGASEWPAQAGPVLLASGPYASSGSYEEARYARYATPPPMALAPVGRGMTAWQRWLVIGGTAIAAIVVAFMIARVVRGPGGTAPATTAAAGVEAPRRSAQPPAAAPAAQPPPGATASGSDAARDRAAIAAVAPAPGSATEPSPKSAAAPDEEATGGPPVVGTGPCRLAIATTPAGSIVKLDDVAVGASPLTIASTCEKHKIEVSHARYQRQARWVTLAADKPADLEVTLARPIHAVTVTSFPPGAQLSIEGRRAGTTPTVVQMMGFSTVNLTFSKPGFQSVTKKVYSKVPQDRVSVKLMK